jgi:hypothetical protein
MTRKEQIIKKHEALPKNIATGEVFYVHMDGRETSEFFANYRQDSSGWISEISLIASNHEDSTWSSNIKGLEVVSIKNFDGECVVRLNRPGTNEKVEYEMSISDLYSLLVAIKSMSHLNEKTIGIPFFPKNKMKNISITKEDVKPLDTRIIAAERELKRMHHCVYATAHEAAQFLPEHKRVGFIKAMTDNADFILNEALKDLSANVENNCKVENE